MKLSKYPLKKSRLINTEKKRAVMSRSMENIKISDYTTVKKEDESNLYQIALDEYKDLFPEILLLPKKDFFDSLERYIKISLATSDKIFPKGALKNILNLIEKKYYNEELIKIEKKLRQINYDNNSQVNFLPHCKYTKKMMHSCDEKIINIENEYYYCPKCKLIYKPDYILLKCDKCNINYFSEIYDEESKEKNKANYKPATWSKYHCNALINDTMKCQICKSVLYLNTNNKDNTLYCLKCNKQINPYEISWKCVLCNSPFFSEPKVYNKYELKMMLIAIKNALFKGIEAKPKYLPCCKIYGDKVKSFKYLHKNECNGILYEGELNNKKIIVCSKCHMLNYYENQFWLCPVCKVRFHLKLGNINLNLNDINNERIQNMETISNNKEQKNIYHKRRNNLNSSMDIKKNIFDICMRKEEEDNNNNINNMDKSGIVDINSRKKKILSVRNKNRKRMNFCKSYYKYNEKDNEDDNDHSHIIYSNFKRNENNRRKEIKEFMMTNYKENNNETEEKNKIIHNLVIPSNFNINNKIIGRISRNIASNIKSIEKCHPSQIINTGFNQCNNNLIQNSEAKKNYVNFLKNKPRMYKHIKNKLSYDQCNLNNNEENENEKINKKRIIGFNRILSQKEIRENNIFKNNNKFIISNYIKKPEKEKEVKILLKDNDNLLKQIEQEKEKEKAKNNSNNNANNNFNSDDFKILRQIGQGSYGKIFEVEDTYHHHYALKKIIAYSVKEVEIIKTEYNILYGLQNLDIDLIGIYGIETKKLDSTTYAINVLMELAKCDWEQEIKQRSSIKKYYTEKELIIILKKLVKTFSRLQKANVSHRDIKPQNILICNGENDLNLKIADFGEAKKIINKNEGNNTIKQTIRGTELYMSPILFNSLRNKMIYKYTKHNTYKSDVFSLGYCLLLASSLSYRLLCEIRELKTMNEIKNIIGIYINKGISFYSKKYWDIILNMIELDEKNRPDFIELDKLVQDL